jgi:membrane-associated phospholipid phosphatase
MKRGFHITRFHDWKRERIPSTRQLLALSPSGRSHSIHSVYTWLSVAVSFAVLFAVDLLGVKTGVSTPADRSLDLTLHGWFDRSTFAVFESISTFGGALVRAVLVALGAIVLVFTGRWRSAAVLVGAVAGGALLNVLVKDLVARPRPHLFGDALHTSGFSFPSGHAMSSVIFFGVLVQLSWILTQRRDIVVIVALIGLLMSILIGLARIVLGVHYPSDVVAGYALGIVWLACIFPVLSMVEKDFKQSHG